MAKQVSSSKILKEDWVIHSLIQQIYIEPLKQVREHYRYGEAKATNHLTRFFSPSPKIHTHTYTHNTNLNVPGILVSDPLDCKRI